MKKRMISVVVVFALLITSALAASSYQTITVDYNINLEINGGTPELTDADGNQVKPFVHNGTTYVPIRAVAEEMGAYVGYDANTRTAIIFQDDVEAMSVVHDISVANNYFDNIISNMTTIISPNALLSISQLQTYLSEIESVSSDTYNETYEKYNLLIENQNIYASEVAKCMNALNESYSDVCNMIEVARLYLQTRNNAYMTNLQNIQLNYALYNSCSYLVETFFDMMW